MKEVYGELLVPVVKNLELELGYRLLGLRHRPARVDTYKGLFSWKAHDTVTIRGGYQYATRTEHRGAVHRPEPGRRGVPVGGSLLGGRRVSPWGNVRIESEPRAGAGPVPAPSSATARRPSTRRPTTRRTGPNGFTRQNAAVLPAGNRSHKGQSAGEAGGGPHLHPRRRPHRAVRLVERLTLTIDGYRIKVIGPRSRRSPRPRSTTTASTSTASSNPTYDVNNPFCKLIRRNPVTGDREEVDALYSNLGTLETQGVDLSTYHLDAYSSARAHLAIRRARATWLDYFRYQPDPNCEARSTPRGTIRRRPPRSNRAQYDYRLLTNVSYRLAARSTSA